jgi:uncharacterized protein YcnI
VPISRSRPVVVALATGGALWLLATPALAHVEVSAKPARAGASDAVVSFDAEGESTTSGIVGVRIQLPPGITDDQVTLDDAPTGWKLTSGDGVVTIKGPALKPGGDAEYAVRIAELPNAKQLVFKTVVTYADGHKDSWIELDTSSEGEPENPAPVLKLAPAAAATPATPSTTPVAPTTTAAPTAAATTAAAAAQEDDGDGLSTALGVVVGIVVVLAIAGAVAYVIRRRNSAA